MCMRCQSLAFSKTPSLCYKSFKNKKPTIMKNSITSGLKFLAFFLLSLNFLISCTHDPLENEEEITYDLSAVPSNDANLIEGQYIVVLSNLPGKKSPRALAALEALSKEVEQMPEARITRKYNHALTGFAAKLTEEQAEKLKRDPRVESIEQDSYMYPAGEVTVQPSPDWGLDRIDQREATLDQSYSYTASGTGVTAYIVDTGIRDTHNDFGKRVIFGHDFIWEDEPENRDILQGEGADCWGHGTAVAAVLGGAKSGVAKNVSLVNVRVWGCDGASPRTRIIAAVDWITQNATHPAVVNMSGAHADSQVAVAIQNSIEEGIVYVGVAGNQSEDSCESYPHDTSGRLTVGASDIDNKKAEVSNYGDCVDLYAPGVSITSASHLDDSSFIQYTGTSMSSPMVAGVAALFLEAYPEATPAQTKAAIVNNSTPDAVTDVPSGPNNLLYSLWESDFTLPTMPALILEATGEKVRSNYVANLTWNPTASQYIYVYIDGVQQLTEHFNDGEQQIQLPKKGKDATYTLQICEVSYDNCSNEVTLIFGNGSEEPVNESPSAGFDYTTNDLNVQFSDRSTDSDGSIVEWTWNFGDGNSSAEQNPNHSYAQAGSFSVSLTVTDDTGNSDTITRNVSVSAEEPSPRQYELSAIGYKVKGNWQTDLSWTPSNPDQFIDIFRNGFRITVPNTGTYTDVTNQKGSGSIIYKVCDEGSISSCSDEVTVQF